MKIKVNDIRVHCELSGKDDGPIVILSHSLACNLNMWEPQVRALEKEFRVLRYDTRGHGLSDAPKGLYTLDMLGEDAVGLLNALNIDSVHWVGLSMGGMIGQNMALNYPDRLKSLILCDTSPKMPDEMQPMWQERIDEARKGGMKTRLQPTLENWFIPDFLKENPPALDDVRRQFLSTPVEGYIGCIEAIRGLDYVDRLKEIKIPTLIIVGREDPGTPVEVSKIMHDLVEGSELKILSFAAHLSNVAQPEAFNSVLLEFLRKQ